ncbi:hypothetical protein DOS68_03570, partial [Staphylococcus felis]|uniref:SdrD B-like domain-containing protein n=1 Tax=Staphylococcus felis TaxID=46127 RepID=UPI000E3813AE
ISDELDSDGRIVNATINNANNMTIDSGFYKPTYKLGDYVWEDVDKDGLQGTNENEKPLQSVEEILRGENGQEIARTTTDEKGYYEFSGLTNGNYEVEFVNPEGYEETPVRQGQDEGKDSNDRVVKVTINTASNTTIYTDYYRLIYELGDYLG